MIDFLNTYIKDLSFFSLYLMVFIRSILVLLAILFLQRIFTTFLEKIILVKKENTELISPFGTLFFPFLLFIVQSASNSFLIFGWLKPKYLKNISFFKNLFLVLSGTFFYLVISFLLKFIFFDFLLIENFIEDNLVFWFLEPVAKYAIKLSFLLFILNFLPIYPFEFSKLLVNFFKLKDQDLFYFKIASIIISIFIAFNNFIWQYFDKINFIR